MSCKERSRIAAGNSFASLGPTSSHCPLPELSASRLAPICPSLPGTTTKRPRPLPASATGTRSWPGWARRQWRCDKPRRLSAAPGMIKSRVGLANMCAGSTRICCVRMVSRVQARAEIGLQTGMGAQAQGAQQVGARPCRIASQRMQVPHRHPEGLVRAHCRGVDAIEDRQAV